MSVQPAGYSGTPLPTKLGIKPGHRVAFVHAPESFRDTLGPLPGVERVDDGDGPADVVVFFTTRADGLRAAFRGLGARVHPAGMLWISWPKKSSGVATELTEDAIRAIGLEAGMVDVKVCAVDDVWSGLKFVYRLADRPAVAGARGRA
jgi:hypothetical protein